MKLLLDTHVLLWWLIDDPRLRPQVRAIIADQRNTVFVSLASFWEIAVKARKGKLVSSGPSVWRAALDEGFAFLPVTQDHLKEFEEVPVHAGHGDPFDVLLLAQAKSEGASLVTADRHMATYGIPYLGVG